MKPFMDDDFLLSSPTAKELYHSYAKKMPICDYHNHLNAKEIFDDKKYDNITQLWLGGDHYKWRAMRANAVNEQYITGGASNKDKFDAWASTVPQTFGNPLYHWTHLELRRYFGIEDTLSKDTADEIYDKCNKMLTKDEFSVRSLLEKMNVKYLCTTDDPIDNLEYHKKLAKEYDAVKVLPTFRPDKLIDIEKTGYPEYIASLGKVANMSIKDVEDLEKAISDRLDYFQEVGCKISDHSLGANFYEKADKKEVGQIMKKALEGAKLSEEEIRKYKGYVLVYLGREYSKRDMTMQLHIGALRNNSARMFEQKGADIGYDSLDDFNYAPQINGLMNELDYTKNVPRTVFYCLNSKDNEMLAATAGNFQSSSIKCKIQFGTAWWFLDQKRGMQNQLDTLANFGLLSGFIGMLTDSRSFLSFPRHEYFRRILCSYVGNIVENGEYPKDMKFLGQMIENICYNNAVKYVGL